VRRDLTERTFGFAVRVVRLCRVLDRHRGVSQTIGNQLLRSATSIGANVEEAQAGQSRADFINRISIACKEARESLYWIRLLIAAEIMPEFRLDDLRDEANQIVAILTTIVRNARANPTTSHLDIP